MSLQTNLDALVAAIAADVRDISMSLIGTANQKNVDVQAALNTVAKDHTGAINELLLALSGIDLTALIDDTSVATDKTYSSQKVTDDIAAAIAALVDTSPAALDTLNELAAALGDDANFAATMTAALALKANIADTKSTTELGAAVDTTDYEAAYVAARDA